MNDWKKLSQTSLLHEKEDFYCSLEDITDADYRHTKRLGRFYDKNIK